MQLNNLHDVLMEQLADLRSAETQLISALPKMSDAAHLEELRQAFADHLLETEEHVRRLEDVFADLGVTVPDEMCEAMQGLIKEGEEIIEAKGDPVALDAALIAAAQRVEHYEIAAYGTARALAGELGYDKTASILGETLTEEGKADQLLTKLAEGGLLKAGINEAAATR